MARISPVVPRTVFRSHRDFFKTMNMFIAVFANIVDSKTSECSTTCLTPSHAQSECLFFVSAFFQFFVAFEVIVVDVVFVVVVDVEISDAFVGSACPPGSGLAAALPLEMPAVHPVRVGCETHRLQEKRFFIHANQQRLGRARYLLPAQTICRSAKMRINCTCKLQESDIIEGNMCITSICTISSSTAIVVRSILFHNEPPRLCNLGRLITNSKQTNRLNECNHRTCIHLENFQRRPR